jgi:hypothetical protein
MQTMLFLRRENAGKVCRQSKLWRLVGLIWRMKNGRGEKNAVMVSILDASLTCWIQLLVIWCRIPDPSLRPKYHNHYYES